MIRIIEMHDRPVRSVDHKVILNQVIGSKAEEVDAGSHEIASLSRGRGFDHDADGNPGIVGLAPEIQLIAYFGQNPMRRIQVVDSGYKREENPHRTEHRSSIEASQLFLEHIRVFETEPEAPHAEIHVYAIPALLVDSDIDGAERDRRALRRLQ